MIFPSRRRRCSCRRQRNFMMPISGFPHRFFGVHSPSCTSLRSSSGLYRNFVVLFIRPLNLVIFSVSGLFFFNILGLRSLFDRFTHPNRTQIYLTRRARGTHSDINSSSSNYSNNHSKNRSYRSSFRIPRGGKSYSNSLVQPSLS